MRWYHNHRRLTDDNPELIEAINTVKAERKKLGLSGKGVKDEARRRIGAVMSVTSITGTIGDKAGLLNWYMSLGVDAGVEHGDVEKAKKAARIKQAEAADRGTRFHEAFENVCNGRDVEDDDEAIIKACDNLIAFFEEHDCAGGASEFQFTNHDLFSFGGTIDYKNEVTGHLLDFKTTKNKRKPYVTEVAQIAAYRSALGMGMYPHCWNMYFDQRTGELYRIQEWTREQLDHGYMLFKNAYNAIGHTEAIERGL